VVRGAAVLPLAAAGARAELVESLEGRLAGPRAGFKGESSEDGDPDDAPRKVELSVDEARMVPLSITVPVFSLPLVVLFQRLCAAPDPCTG
jgi:hypothetical protein